MSRLVGGRWKLKVVKRPKKSKRHEKESKDREVQEKGGTVRISLHERPTLDRERDNQLKKKKKGDPNTPDRPGQESTFHTFTVFAVYSRRQTRVTEVLSVSTRLVGVRVYTGVAKVGVLSPGRRVPGHNSSPGDRGCLSYTHKQTDVKTSS